MFFVYLNCENEVATFLSLAVQYIYYIIFIESIFAERKANCNKYSKVSTVHTYGSYSIIFFNFIYDLYVEFFLCIILIILLLLLASINKDFYEITTGKFGLLQFAIQFPNIII